MKRVILVFLVLFIGSCATTEQDIQKSDAHYQLGLSYFNDNKIQMAYVEYQMAIELNPNNKDAHYAIGIVYLALDDMRNAKESFLKAISIDPNFAGAHYNLGVTYAKMGMWSDSVGSFKKAINNPVYRKHQIAYSSLGDACYRLGRIDDAIEAYIESIKRSQDFYRPYYGLALAYNAKGRYADAATAISRAIELDPLFRGNKEKAIGYFKERNLRAMGEEFKDIKDYLEILKY